MGPEERIPQINMNVEYVTSVRNSTFEESYDISEISAPVEEEFVFPDNTRIVLSGEDLVLEFSEQNSVSRNSSFEIQVYKIEDNIVDGVSKEKLVPLVFSQNTDNKRFIEKDGLLLERGDDGFEEPEFFTNREITSRHVEHYFDIITDRNIPQAVICPLTPRDEVRGSHARKFFDCSEYQDSRDPIDIYEMDEYEEPCED